MIAKEGDSRSTSGGAHRGTALPHRTAVLTGWGIFGFGGAGHQLAPTDKLYLGSPVKYVVATLVLHLIYGNTTGWLNPVWIEFESAEQATA